MSLAYAQHLPEAGYLRLSQVLQLVPVGKSTWWQWVKDGRAPAAVKLSPRVTAWRASEIRAFLDAN
ncbi:MAG: helix-turn-helix transcriptional regulator [Chloroflexota bacterium]